MKRTVFRTALLIALPFLLAGALMACQRPENRGAASTEAYNAVQSMAHTIRAFSLYVEHTALPDGEGGTVPCSGTMVLTSDNGSAQAAVRFWDERTIYIDGFFDVNAEALTELEALVMESGLNALASSSVADDTQAPVSLHISFESGEELRLSSAGPESGGWDASPFVSFFARLAGGIHREGAAPEAEDMWEEAEKDPTLLMLRQSMIETENICGVAYLGCLDGSLREEFPSLIAGTAYETDWTFLGKLPAEAFISSEGSEVYCVIPRDESAQVIVSEWLLDDDGREREGQVLYRSQAGHPLVLRGNVSDIFPNMMLTVIAQDGSRLEYSPRLSLLDGTLVIPGVTIYPEGGVSDLTVYVPLILSCANMTGDWTCTGCWTQGGIPYSCTLTIGEDHNLAYAFGPDNDAYNVWYEGRWNTLPGETDEIAVFDMHLVEDLSGTSHPDTFTGNYQLKYYPPAGDNTMLVECVSGTGLSLGGPPVENVLFIFSVG